jgi:hypothetical protein
VRRRTHIEAGPAHGVDADFQLHKSERLQSLRAPLAERESAKHLSEAVPHRFVTALEIRRIPYTSSSAVRQPPVQSGYSLGPLWGLVGLVRGKLTNRKVQTAKPGKYADGGNLYLIVSETGARKWVFRFQWRGRAKERGLGSASDVPLAEARLRAGDARLMLAKGINPIEAAKRDRGAPTFGAMADQVCETLASGFRNPKHRAQWKSTLQTHAAPLTPAESPSPWRRLEPSRQEMIEVASPPSRVLRTGVPPEHRFGEAARPDGSLGPLLRTER